MSMLVAPETVAVRPMSCRPVVISVAALGLPVAANATPVVAPVLAASATAWIAAVVAAAEARVAMRLLVARHLCSAADA